MTDTFEDLFHDTRRHQPQPGECLARFSAMADFEDGWIKKQVVYLLKNKRGGAKSARAVMRNLVQATERDSVRVPLEMAEALAGGKTEADVLSTPHRFQLEQFYWTRREHVPDSKHWEIIELLPPALTAPTNVT